MNNVCYSIIIYKDILTNIVEEAYEVDDDEEEADEIISKVFDELNIKIQEDVCFIYHCIYHIY